MSHNISIADELYTRLSEKAEQNKVPIETLIENLLGEAIVETDQSDIIEQITLAYHNGTAPPTAGEWEQVVQELASTKPAFATLEAAMDQTRNRP